MYDVIKHVINGALGAVTVDKYGFPSGPRLATSNLTVAKSYPLESGGYVYYNDYNEVTEDATRRRGDFHSPTPYYISQTKRKGARVTRISSSWNPSITPMQPASIYIMDARAGSVRSFGFLPRLEEDAAALVNAKILDAASQWSAAVDAAEFGQTVGMFRTMSERLLLIMVGVAERNPKTLLQGFGLKPTRRKVARVKRKFAEQELRAGLTVGDAAAEYWLMYRYGIMPLVYSQEDALKALLDGYNPCFESQVTITREGKYVADKITDNTISSAIWSAEETGYYKKSVRIKTTVSFKDALGARIAGNPAAVVLGTAWELVPFSFVVDWFIGVGDYINQLNLETLLASYRSVITIKGLTRFESRVTSLSKNTGNPASRYVLLEPLRGVQTETRSFERKLGFQPTLGNLMWGTGLSPTFRQFDTAALTFSKVRKLSVSSFK